MREWFRVSTSQCLGGERRLVPKDNLARSCIKDRGLFCLISSGQRLGGTHDQAEGFSETHVTSVAAPLPGVGFKMPSCPEAQPQRVSLQRLRKPFLSNQHPCLLLKSLLHLSVRAQPKGDLAKGCACSLKMFSGL